MKILHVIPTLSFKYGGPVKAVLGLTSAQAEAGADVRLLTTDYLLDEKPESLACETKIFHCLTDTWQFAPALGKALTEEVRRADVVNLHTLWSYPIAAAARACRRQRVPYILRTCGMLDGWSLSQKRLKKSLYTSLIERRNINAAAALWFTSEEEREGARPFGYKCPDSVIPLGLPLREYRELPRAGSFRARFPELDQRRIILFLSRIAPKKQPGLLLKAFAAIHREFPDTSLVIAGPGEEPYLLELGALARALGIKDRVLFVGPLDGAEVRDALMDAEIFALPSMHENFGVAVVEAMACSVPVIISKMVNLAAEVVKAEAGLAINPDEASLEAGLRQLLADPSASRRMGERGRRLALERFTWEGLVPAVFKLYEEAIERQAKRGVSEMLLSAGEGGEAGRL